MTPRARSYDSARPGGRIPTRSGGRQRSGDARRDPRPRPKKRKDPRWTKLAIIFGAIVMVGSGLTVVGPKLVAAWAIGEVEQIDTIPDEFRGENLEGAINFLLLGLDQSLNGRITTSPRADSIVLVHIPAAHDRAYMISLPRDLLVAVPALPEVGLGWRLEPEACRPGEGGDVCRVSPEKLNAAFWVGARATDDTHAGVWWQDRPRDVSKAALERGVSHTIRTINGMVEGGLQWHGSAIIDFAGFDKVVEAIGTVQMCVDFGGLVDSDDKNGDNEEIWSIHRFADGKYLPNNMASTAYNNYGGASERATRPQRAHYTEGCQELAPWQALDLSRQRVQFGTGDYGRHQMQQALLKAIVAQVASPDTLTNFNTIGRLQQAAGDLLKLDLGGHPVEDWVWTVKDLRSDDMVSIKTYGGTPPPGISKMVGGQAISFQRVDADLVDLLKAVQSDTVVDFLSRHKTWAAE